jgi:hypothetical protein
LDDEFAQLFGATRLTTRVGRGAIAPARIRVQISQKVWLVNVGCVGSRLAGVTLHREGMIGRSRGLRREHRERGTLLARERTNEVPLFRKEPRGALETGDDGGRHANLHATAPEHVQ